jgi:hypothetical protein
MIKVQTPRKHTFFGHEIHNYYLMNNNIFIKLVIQKAYFFFKKKSIFICKLNYITIK